MVQVIGSETVVVGLKEPRELSSRSAARSALLLEPLALLSSSSSSNSTGSLSESKSFMNASSSISSDMMSVGSSLLDHLEIWLQSLHRLLARRPACGDVRHVDSSSRGGHSKYFRCETEERGTQKVIRYGVWGRVVVAGDNKCVVDLLLPVKFILSDELLEIDCKNSIHSYMLIK